MEDDLKKERKTTLKKRRKMTSKKEKKKKKGRPPQKKYLFSIPLKSRGKPFLGLAQLSKILFILKQQMDIHSIIGYR